MRRRNNKKKGNKKKYCYFCSHNINYIDYKDTETLQKFTSNYQRILPRSRMGADAKHQRELAQAVKRARYMALIPYMNGQK